MTAGEPILDSPTPRVAAQIAEYLASDGARPVHPSGLPLLLLTTVGRNTGRRHRTMLLFLEDEGSFVIVASDGGGDRDPQWYRNIAEDPHVELLVGTQSLQCVARSAAGQERARLWGRMTDAHSAYLDMQASSARTFPVVVLTPSGS